jgi:hypothetical protein
MIMKTTSRHPLTASWTKGFIDEMIAELLGCTEREAKQISAKWLMRNESPRDKVIDLARVIDDGGDVSEIIGGVAALKVVRTPS